MHFAGAEKCIVVFPEGRKQNLDGIELVIVPALTRKLWAVHWRCLQRCILQAPQNAFSCFLKVVNSVWLDLTSQWFLLP